MELHDMKLLTIKLQKALEILGFSTEEIVYVFKTLSAIIKIGNLVFVPTTNIDGTEGCHVSNEYGRF